MTRTRQRTGDKLASLLKKLRRFFFRRLDSPRVLVYTRKPPRRAHVCMPLHPMHSMLVARARAPWEVASVMTVTSPSMNL